VTTPSTDPNQRYQVIRRLDAGGMAEIFLARALSIQGMEKLVAIKRVLPALTTNASFNAMFLDEARLSLGLSHANIVTVTDVSQSGGTYFIVMEYVEGFNLRHLFQRASELGFRIPVALACFILMEVCKGLEHAHTKRDASGKHLRIVHRDLSPPNVLVSRAGEVKITDFGLARATTQLSKTDPGVVKGKYSYLAPEVVEGKTADHRVDIFAAGIVLWELLANRRLFYGPTDVETVELVRKAEVPPLSRFNPDVKPELTQILARALARDPRKRFTSAREFGEALADYLAHNSLRATNFDLVQLLDRLFASEAGGGRAEDRRAREARIGAMIDEEIANLSMAGHVAASRNLVGREPLTPSQLELGALDSPRYDLSAVWQGPPSGAVPRAIAPQRHAPPPTLQAFRDAPDVETLTRLLEGSSVMQLPTLPPETPEEGGRDEPQAAEGRPRWFIPVLLGSAVITAVVVALFAT
jgi:serine/threonine protein kinase